MGGPLDVPLDDYWWSIEVVQHGSIFHTRLGIFSGHNGRDYIVATTKIVKFLFKVANSYFTNICFRNLSFAKRYKSSPPLLYP